jgi:hypothetical protein
MSVPPIIRIKRSSVPGKKPEVNQLPLGELALNTNDAELYIARERVGFGTDILPVGIGAKVTNILYVTEDGNDTNTGRKLGDAKATIEGALAEATTGTVIKVSAGSYLENNPLIIPDQVSIVGDSLREVTVTPQNSGDLFYVGNGNYIAEMSFVGAPNSGAIFSFNPDAAVYIDQSPYIQNCTNFIPNSIGLKVNGKNAIGPTKSMVLDSYTQYNQGGIGASITNEAYAQLVSLFTICNETAVFCGSGGACDLTNSNSSFGNFGLVSDGVGPLKFTGIVTATAEENSSTFVLNLNTPTLNIVDALYDNVTGVLTAYTDEPHKFSVGMGVSLTGLEFSCEDSPPNLVYPSGNKGYVFETRTVAPGRYVDAHNLIQANRQEIIDGAYDEILIQNPSFVNPNPDKCKRDIGFIVDAVSLDVRDFTNQNVIRATKSYFNLSGQLIENGVEGEIAETIIAFEKARDLMKLAITNNLTITDPSIIPDPITEDNTDPASCADVQTFIDNLVAIITTSLDDGNLTTLPSVSLASTTFSVNVGVSTLEHTYESGGEVKINVIRPFDGQVVYFGDLFFEVGEIKVSAGGTGYEFNADITIEEPETEWGVPAQAVGQVEGGRVTSVEIISSGRGYTRPPRVTISGPDVGINTATAEVILRPSYYSIINSTPISSGICTITVNDNVPFEVGIGTAVPFFKQSRLLASGHSLEYIGSGTEIARALPSTGGVPIQDNETVMRDGGLVVFTSTDQSGNFRIGDGVVINQQTGTISGTFYSKSLFSTMTPFILALGGD